MEDIYRYSRNCNKEKMMSSVCGPMTEEDSPCVDVNQMMCYKFCECNYGFWRTRHCLGETVERGGLASECSFTSQSLLRAIIIYTHE